jgi:hypothetical protein
LTAASASSLRTSNRASAPHPTPTADH